MVVVVVKVMIAHPHMLMLGHITFACDKPPIMVGDVCPLMAQVLNRENDYGIEMKGEVGFYGLRNKEKKWNQAHIQAGYQNFFRYRF